VQTAVDERRPASAGIDLNQPAGRRGMPVRLIVNGAIGLPDARGRRPGFRGIQNSVREYCGHEERERQNAQHYRHDN